jgi:hypothetical protein
MHLTDAEVTSIAKFNEAEFNDTALLKLLSKLNSSFEKYEPDKAVMTYFHQHSKTLNFEFDFRNPKEQTNEREPRSKDKKTRPQSSSSDKRTRSNDNKSSKDRRPSNSRHKTGTNHVTNTTTATTVPTKFHCRRASCKQRDTHTNHAHNKYRFKDDVDTSKTYPNIGRAPPKKDKRTNQNSSKNEVVHQSYQHVPIKMLQNLFRKTVQQHHQQHSSTQERVIYVRPRGTLLRTVPKNKPINKTQTLN